MPTARLRWRLFTRGWWGAGARDAQPEGTLRRAVGIAQVKTSELRSRWGSAMIADLDAHSIVRFNGKRYIGAEFALYDVFGNVVQAGLDGTKLTFTKMGPTLDVADYLFVSGGGFLFKVSPAGVASQWGITPPPDDMTATAQSPTTVVVDAMDSAASWTQAGATLADEGTIKQEGTNSMKMTVAASTVGTATKSITVDLSNSGASPDEDFIQIWLRLDNPAAIQRIQFLLSLGGTTFATDYYVRDLLPQTDPLGPDQLAQASSGLDTSVANLIRLGYIVVPPASPGEFDPQPVLQVVDPANGIPIPVTDPSVVSRILNGAAQTTYAITRDTWTLLRLPKATFQRVGQTAGLDWADVQAVRLLIETNAVGQVIAYWDDMKLNGGVGMQGDYGYQVVYLNDNTGTRSDPNPTEVRVSSVNRGKVLLNAIPASTDPQVTHVEVYRTVGNGTLKFRIAKLTNGTNSFLDDVADSATINSAPSATLMSSIQLQLDNARPDDAWDDCFGPHAGSMWWCRSLNVGEKGVVFFSPAGRAESGAGGFLTLTSDDEPTMKGIIFNGSAYVFTTVGLFQIVGTEPPYVGRRVYGVPGTLWPLTVTLTPYGIAYLALDGPRLFDGVGSRLIAPGACELLFRGETVENVAFDTSS